MKILNLYDYKEYLINFFRYECDNNIYQIKRRKNVLESKYNDEYLETIIVGTYDFINKILELSKENYFGYISIPLEIEPDIIYIDLNLTGGWMSDTVVRDSNNNFYSIGLLKKIFGQYFQIEPYRVELKEEYEGDDYFCVLSEVPSYYLYIQCKKEIIESVRDSFNKNNNRTKVLRITNQ